MADEKTADKKSESTELEKKISDLETQNKLLVKEAMEKKEHIRKLEETKQSEEEKHLKEQNKYKELYDGVVPKVERLNKLEPILNQIFDTEVVEVPEEKRDLIPQFQTIEEKILWVRNAKLKGLFKPIADSKKAESDGKKLPATSVQSKTQTNESSAEFLSIPASDPRLQKLSLSEYRQWKEHNQKPSSGVRGWGG